jgi:phytoene dehydrogenase-like protein
VNIPACDVVIIGAGISGLTAAALLAQGGLHVRTIEAGPRPGGYLAGFQREGFTFDTAVQYLNQCGPGGFCDTVFRFLGPDYPRAKSLKRLARYMSETHDHLLTDDPTVLRERWIAEHPEERRGIVRFFEDARILGERFRQLRFRMRAIETMSLPEKARLGLQMGWWVLPVWKHLRMTAEQGLDRYFQGPEIKGLFASEESMMSVIVPFAHAFSGEIQGPPEGGGQTYIGWLRGRVEASGSSVSLGRRVDRIVLENGRAAGVVLEDGETIRSRWVIAACDVETLYERMLPPGTAPEDLLRRLRAADLYYSNVTLFLGLDCDPASLGLGEECVGVTRDGLSRQEHLSGDPHKSILNLVAPSVRDPTLAPKGKGTLTIHCPAWMNYGDRWKTGEEMRRGPEYRRFKHEVAEVLLDRVERALDARIRAHIEVLDIATPVTYWRYTGNRDGSIMGAKPTNRNIRNKLAHYRTPVPRLLLAGHWAQYGGGVPIAMQTAVNASLLVLRQDGPEAFRSLRDAVDGRAPLRI